MSKKTLAVMMAIVMVLSMFAVFTSCGDDEKEQGMSESPLKAPTLTKDFDVKDDFKIGFIMLHDENSTYDKNFINAAKSVKEVLGLRDDQFIVKTNIPESSVCYDTAKDLVSQGCDIIFADSFGHESFMIQAAREYPDVQFCHATGTMAHTENLANYHNAFASIYQGRYLAGIAAGMKLNEMIKEKKITEKEAVMGYVGAFTYAEVISGLTSFYLGAKSVCPSVTMKVRFTGSWYDQSKEQEAANSLIADKCVLISQHADSMGAPTACETAGVPNVSYNGSTVSACPNTFIVSSRINWAPYYEFVVNAVANGEEIPADWTGTIETGSVVLTDVNEKAAAAGTADEIAKVKGQLIDGTVEVFNTALFTVGDAVLTTYMADVDTDPAYTPDTEAVANGYFHESEYRSAPYFDVRIDGIELLNSAF